MNKPGNGNSKTSPVRQPVLLGLFTGTAVGVGYLLAGVPNVELMTLVIALAGALQSVAGPLQREEAQRVLGSGLREVGVVQRHRLVVLVEPPREVVPPPSMQLLKWQLDKVDRHPSDHP